MTINEAERIIEEWLREEGYSAVLPYAEKLVESGYWVLDGRFNVQKLAKQFAKSQRVVEIRPVKIGLHRAE